MDKRPGGGGEVPEKLFSRHRLPGRSAASQDVPAASWHLFCFNQCIIFRVEMLLDTHMVPIVPSTCLACAHQRRTSAPAPLPCPRYESATASALVQG